MHDGFPHTPVHFLMAGREVITNVKMPYTHHVKMAINEQTYGKAKIDLIKKIRDVKKKFKAKPNKKAN